MAQRSRQQRFTSAFDFASDPKLTALAERDETMAGLIQAIGPYRLTTDRDAWSVLFSAVVYQQITGSAARATCLRIKAANKGAIPTPAQLLAQPEGCLRAYGLTSRKEQTLRGLASAIMAGELDLKALARMSDSDLMSALTAWSGVGPWTTGMWMVFHLGRPDVAFPGDIGVRKAIETHYDFGRTPTPAETARFAETWAPYRTVASWYLWKSLPGFPEPGFG